MAVVSDDQRYFRRHYDRNPCPDRAPGSLCFAVMRPLHAPGEDRGRFPGNRGHEGNRNADMGYQGNLSGNLCSHGGHWKRLWIYAFPSVQRRLAGTNPPEFRRQRESDPGAAAGRPWRWDCMFADSALCKRMPPAVSLYICRAGNPVWRTGRFQSQLPDCQAV